MNQPIFLLGTHKSGTTLLRSLFDGHPDLFVLPKESHLFQMSGFWVNYRLRYTPPTSFNQQQWIDNYAHLLETYNQKTNWQADSVTLNQWDVNAFRQHLQTAVITDTRSRFTAVFEAMHLALYGTPLPPQQRVVEKSVEHAEFALDLYHLFPDAKFIHIIRHPYANLVSLRRFKNENGYPSLRPFLQSFTNSYYYLLKNQRLIPAYFVIRYEDLVANPTPWVQKIATFVDIPFHDTLLHPTQLGHSWAGNSVYGTTFNAISSDSLHKWQQAIYPCEVTLLHKAIPDAIMTQYQYERPLANGRFWQPMPHEHIKTYLANRLLAYFLP